METANPRTAVGDHEVIELVNEYTKGVKFTVYDLLYLHATSRGFVTDDIDKADNKFTYEEFSNYEKIATMMGV